MPVVRGGLMYVARRLPDAFTALDVIELSSGTTMAQGTFRQVLTMTLLSQGTVWLLTRTGFKTLYVPTERLNWLKQASLACLAPALQQKYTLLPNLP